MMKILLICIMVTMLGACSSATKKGPTYDGSELGACPNSPNCISSLAEDDKHYLEAIEYDITKEQAKEIILEIVKEEKNSEVLKIEDDYIHVIFKSGVFKFIDDLEFVFLEDKNTINFRSAARSGYSDFGVNRKRLERIKKEFYIRAK